MKIPARCRWVFCVPLFVAALSSLADVALFEPKVDADMAVARWKTTDAMASPVGRRDRKVMSLLTGTNAPWPGVTYTAPATGWDLSSNAAVVVRLRNAGTNAVKVFARIDNPGADGTKHCVTGELSLNPGAVGSLRVELRRTSSSTLDGQLFGMRGYPVAPGGDGTVDPSKISQVLIFVHQPGARHAFTVEGISAVGTYVPPTAWVTDAKPYLPLIDRFGQYRHKAWPGKIADVAALSAQREVEAKELAARPGPGDWDRFGGWAGGPKLEASGFFRVQKHDGKWWLVDPEGRLFWSHGVDCVESLDVTPVEGREAWFDGFAEWSSEFDGKLMQTARVLKGHYAGRNTRCFNFAGANFIRKYGVDWRPVYADVIHRRLRSWGMNTIANWSNLAVAQMRRTPYTDSVHSESTRMIEGSEGYWGKFPDVFEPAFAPGLVRQMEAKKGGSAGDPWCLGFFSDNEMSWGDETSLAVAALRSPADQPAKLAFLADLQSTYHDIAKLNEAWGTSHASWDALRDFREKPDAARAAADLKAFYTRVAETYFKAVREAIREVAPKQLYLGCRFAWVNARAAAAAARYCDVVSYNLYQRSVAEFAFNGGADVPLIIGEFHFGALDRGMFHTGLVPVPSQDDRAQAYRDYVEGALRHPQFVGTHWFQWQDEPTTGRAWDEENYQIGLVDIADTPYRETVDAVRAVGEHMYRLRLGGK